MKKVGLLTIVWILMGLIGIGVVAQDEAPQRPVITPENIDQLEQIAMLGRGEIFDMAYSPDGQTLAVATSITIWLHDITRLDDEPRSLEGHSKIVTTVEYSPDGLFIASGSEDGTIRLWDTQTGETVRIFGDSTDTELIVTDLTFSPNGERLVAGYRDSIVRIWDVETGAIQNTLEGHADRILDVAYSPDGRLIASASRNESVRVWDAETGNIEQFLDGISVTFSPDGQSVATGAQTGLVQIWDVATGERGLRLSGHESTIVALNYSPDGLLLMSASNDATIHIWDTQTGDINELIQPSETEEMYVGRLQSALYSPDGRTVTMGLLYNNVWIWDVETNTLAHDFSGYTGLIERTRYSPDGKYLIASFNDQVIVWDLQQQTIHREIPQSGRVYPVNEAVVFLTVGEQVRVTNLLTDEVLLEVDNVLYGVDGFFDYDIADIANNRFLNVLIDETVIQIWDLNTQELILTLDNFNRYGFSMDYSDDNQFVAIKTVDNTIQIWDLQTGENRLVLDEFGTDNEIIQAIYSPDGQFILTTQRVNDGAQSQIDIWNAQTGDKVMSMVIEYGYYIEYSWTGDFIFSYSYGKSILLDAQTGELITGGNMISARFSNDDKFFAFLMSEDETLYVFDTETREIIMQKPIENGVTLSFEPDNSWVIVGLSDGTIQFINIQTGETDHILEGHKNIPYNITYSPDRRFIVSSSNDRTIRIWGIPTSDTP